MIAALGWLFWAGVAVLLYRDVCRWQDWTKQTWRDLKRHYRRK